MPPTAPTSTSTSPSPSHNLSCLVPAGEWVTTVLAVGVYSIDYLELYCSGGTRLGPVGAKYTVANMWGAARQYYGLERNPLLHITHAANLTCIRWDAPVGCVRRLLHCDSSCFVSQEAAQFPCTFTGPSITPPPPRMLHLHLPNPPGIPC